MFRMVFVSVILLGILTFLLVRIEGIYSASQPARVSRIDIYTDRLTYRTGVYETHRTLDIGLKAASDPPKLIEVHDCAAVGRLAAVIEVVRENGADEFEIVLPTAC